MDVLSDAIAAMRTGLPHSSRTLMSAPWGLRFAASNGAGFHVILQGSCWLLPPGQEPVALSPGDVVFLPHGRGHAIADDPTTPLTDVVQTPDGNWVLAEDPPPGAGPTTLMLCGAYRLNRARAHPLLTGLPDVVHLPARIGAHPALRAAVDLLGRELDQPGPGSDAVVPALLDTLLIYILRAWLDDHAGQAATGWAAALADPAVADALHAIHHRPAHPWTVEELGARAGLSRAAFARRFATVVGQPPLAYLTWWRMIIASQLLGTSDAPLRVVAQNGGYSSEFAFAKAFKRQFGISPGSYRRQHDNTKHPVTPRRAPSVIHHR
ncbi:AraC family transcriptional regulator [Micromonospora sp. KC721]|uniref:AraC family transcriptional regulator n=1 Tax=Micromonospora sp. KC721 TaxID=2530380 RepID=UPI0010455201|nr:AraC family transcriptional regulator [Micromonospora sp. KC721]TDB72034.1 AraC family transcriptional regulator [Micromonospora sp. KC721]